MDLGAIPGNETGAGTAYESMQLSPSDFSSCFLYEMNGDPTALGDFAPLTSDGIADFTFSPMLFTAGDTKVKMGPLTCSYLVKNDVTGDGVVFSSQSIMPGVSLRISDLVNSSDCTGPARTAPRKPGAPFSCSQLVGTISSLAGSLEVKTTSNLVMIEASFEPFTNYTVAVNRASVFTAKAGTPDQCSEVEANSGCTRKYAEAYGCMATLVSLPFDDPCYTDVTFHKCVASDWSCGGCDMTCSQVRFSMEQNPSYDPNSDRMWGICRPKCDMVTAGNNSITSPKDNFCAPGCENSDVADGICNPECFNAACFNDGGDCSGATIDSVFAPLRVVHAYSHFAFSMVDRNETDFLVTGEEFYSHVYPSGPEGGRDPLLGVLDDRFAELKMGWDLGLDLVAFSSLTQFRAPLELLASGLLAQGDSGQGTDAGSATEGLALPPSTAISIDDIMDSVEALNDFAIGRAANLLRLYDVNLDGKLEPIEVLKVNPNAEMHDYNVLMLGGLYGNEVDVNKDVMLHGSANIMANILFGIYVSLSGRTLEEPAFDNKGATASIVTLLDSNADGRLSFSEISLAGISPSMAVAIGH